VTPSSVHLSSKTTSSPFFATPRRSMRRRIPSQLRTPARPRAVATRQCWSGRRLKDGELKFRGVVLWVRAPSCQSLTSRHVARLAVASVMGWLMRSQANGWAAGLQPRNVEGSGAQEFARSESSSLGGVWVSRRGTGGVADCGTAEEDDPVTWETLAVPGKARRCGGPVPVLRRAARLTGHERPAPDGEHRSRPAPRGRRAKGRPKA